MKLKNGIFQYEALTDPTKEWLNKMEDSTKIILPGTTGHQARVYLTRFYSS